MRHDHTLADDAAALMRRTGRAVLPLRRLASLLGDDPATAAAALERDPRFRVLRPAPLLNPADSWFDDARAAYAAALEAAGLGGDPVVVLAAPIREAAPPSAGDLLAQTLARLADAAGAVPDAADLAAAAAAAEALARVEPSR